MTIPVELHDGRKLEFPDGTDPAVIQRTVKKLIGVPEIAPEQPTASQRPKLNSGILPNIGFGVAMEPLAKMASGMIAKPLSEIAGVAAAVKDRITGNIEGDPTGFKNYVQESLTYQPRTVAGASNLNPINAMNNMIGAGLGWAGDKAAGLVEDPNREAYSARNVTANALREAVPQAIGIGMVKAAPTIAKKMGEYQVAKAIERGAAEQAYLARNAGMMQTAIDANKLGLVTPVENINPSFGNRFRAKALGSEINIEHSSKINTARIPALVAEEIGAPVNTAFADIAGGKKVIERALAAHDAPYVRVAALPEIVVSDEAIRAMNGLKRAPVAGDASTVAKANAAVDDLVRSISPKTNSLTNSRTYPKSPAAILADIAELRQEGHAIMKAQTSGTVVPDISVVNTAKTKLALAKQLEQMIDDTVSATNPDLLQSLRDARVKKAQIHAWESVRNPSTGQFDVAGLAKRRLYDDMMTGTVGTVADYTNLFPKSMGVSPLEKHGRMMDHARRLSVGGAAGSLVGLALGYPGIGALTGVLVGEGVGALNAMRMMTPAVQNANAMAAAARLSNRSMVGMNPVTPNATPNGIVPYDYGQDVGVPPTRPNWVPGRGNADVRTGVDTTPQLGAPSAESTLRGVKQRNVYDQRLSDLAAQRQTTLAAQRASIRNRMAAARDKRAEIADAATPRAPTGRGVEFDLDPITGRLIPSSAGIKGATPEIWMENTGRNLASASEKVASGQHFRMSAAEKVAWRNTRVDLASVDSGFKSLSDTQIAIKMLDRQWVQDTITKAREKAVGFDEIIKRNQDATKVREATIAREKLMDVVDSLREQLSKPRPDNSRTIQGKVTRAARSGNGSTTSRPPRLGSN